MVRQQIIQQIKNDFQFCKSNNEILGIILYGSHIYDENDENSDIDICIVAPKQKLYQIHKYIYHNIKNNLQLYDIRFFEEFPLHIKGEIIENGIIVLSSDMGELSDYFYTIRKQWTHEKWRIEHVV